MTISMDKKYVTRCGIKVNLIDATSAPALNEQYVSKFEDIKSRYEGDTEWLHIMADGLLCDLLTELGYADVVAKFEKMEKWYA